MSGSKSDLLLRVRHASKSYCCAPITFGVSFTDTSRASFDFVSGLCFFFFFGTSVGINHHDIVDCWELPFSKFV